MSAEEKSESSLKRLSFNILEIKRNHYNRKDLISLSIKIDDKEYEASFLFDNYKVSFFPEFKELDRYDKYEGFRVIYSFIQNIKSKIQYFLDVYMEESEEEEFEYYEREWWMAKEDDDESIKLDEKFNHWVRENSSYLIEYDLSEIENKYIDEIYNYLEKRKNFAKPVFCDKKMIGMPLVEMLKIAVSQENYEEAARIREEIKKEKKTK